MKTYLIFGGTGSLGTTLVKRLLDPNAPVAQVWVFSRDEAKHHKLKLKFPKVNCYLGDMRDYRSVLSAIKKITPDVIINAAAMKQVPACEDYPYEAVMTNIVGTQNLVTALEEYDISNIIKILFISTDKAAKPVNAYGMTKSLAERIHLRAPDFSYSNFVFNAVRYGNVLESTGSVIPIFQERLNKNQDLYVTHSDMTRFLLSLDQAVDLIFEALEDTDGRKIFIPKVKSALIKTLAEVMIDYAYDPSIPEEYRVKVKLSGIRPGEKIHEILVSEEEIPRTQELSDKYIIHDIKSNTSFGYLKKEYSSNDCLMNKEELTKFLIDRGVIQCELE